MERFLLRRADKLIQDGPDQAYCLLLAYELLYLWNALGACLKHSHAAIQIGKLLPSSNPNILLCMSPPICPYQLKPLINVNAVHNFLAAARVPYIGLILLDDIF